MSRWLRLEGDRLTLALRVQPRASRDGVAGVHGDRLKVRIAAPPVDGAANERLRRFIAGLCHVPPAHVSLLQGGGGRDKLVRIEGIAALPEALVKWARSG